MVEDNDDDDSSGDDDDYDDGYNGLLKKSVSWNVHLFFFMF